MSNSEGMFHCSACERAFRWKPELAGRTVRCKCGTKLAVAKTPPAPQKPKARVEREPEFNPLSDMLDDLKAAEPTQMLQPVELSPMPKPKRTWGNSAKHSAKDGLSGMSHAESNDGSDPKLKVAGVGLLLHFGGFVVMGIALCWFVLHIVNHGMPKEGDPADDFQRNISVVMMIAMGMVFLGPLLSLGVPNQAGRGMLIGGLLSYMAAIILPIAIAQSMEASHAKYFILVILAAAVLMLIGTGFVLSFLCRLAAYLGESSLQASAESLLGLYKFMLAGYIVAIVLAGIPVVGPIVNLVIGLVALLLIARYILLNGKLALVMLRR